MDTIRLATLADAEAMKNILFTGETDLPAQKLYESMGYKRIGPFAVILG